MSQDWRDRRVIGFARDVFMTGSYQSVLTVLQRYLSKVNAQVALDRALKRMDLDEDTLLEHHVSSLIPHLEKTINLFVERVRLPHLMSELRVHGQTQPRVEPRIIVITSEADLTEARVQARQMCQDLGTPSLMRQKVVTLVSELARNIVLYAQRGRVELVPFLEPRKRIMVRASDEGPGIGNLEQILSGQYQSKTGMGMGLRGCKRLADRFEIDTNGTGTRVEAEIQV
jgi:serine/threonine-protein kinase RsbT